MTPDEHRAAVEAWRAARDARLRDPDGWLTLTGLYWLGPGEHRMGSDPENDILLSAEGVPAHVGSLLLAGGEVVLRRAGAEHLRLEPDVSGEPTILSLGTLRLQVIQRGERFGLRIRDHAARGLATFSGMENFEIDPSWRLSARFEGAAAGETVEIMDVTGALTREPTPGRVVFERDGTTWKLVALPGGDDGELWLIFADATNGITTYGGGRFLYTDPVRDDGSVVVDFNLAYNPPCVFSPYATCPLPPASNRLALLIEAGERAYRPSRTAEVAGPG